VGDKELQSCHGTAAAQSGTRPLIKEASLLRALREGWIAGAALDTHYYYPMPSDHPLWKMRNVIMTPHISGSARGAYFLPRIWSIFAENLDRFIKGKPLAERTHRAAAATVTDSGPPGRSHGAAHRRRPGRPP